MVAMRLAMARIGFGTRPIRLLPGMLALTTVGMGLLLLPGGGLRHAAAGLLYGGGYSMMHTLLNARILEAVDPSRRGAAFGATLFAFDAGIGIGSFTLGWVIGQYGFRAGWGLGALAVLVAMPMAMRLSRDRPS